MMRPVGAFWAMASSPPDLGCEVAGDALTRFKCGRCSVARVPHPSGQVGTKRWSPS